MTHDAFEMKAKDKRQRAKFNTQHSTLNTDARQGNSQ